MFGVKSFILLVLSILPLFYLVTCFFFACFLFCFIYKNTYVIYFFFFLFTFSISVFKF